MLLLLLACKGAELEATLGDAVGAVPDGLLGITLDTASVLGGRFWNPAATGFEDAEIVVDPLDLTDPVLRARAIPLAPGTLRIGGTAADTVYVALGDGAPDAPPEGYELVLLESTLEGIVDFVQATELGLLFTLNVGPGPRDAAGELDTSNLEGLLEWSAAHGSPVDVWEAGNEINAFALEHSLDLDPEHYARDVGAIAALVDEHTPEAKLAGPATAFWPVTGEFTEFTAPFLAAGGPSVDVVTWHFYPQQSHRCPVASRPASLGTMLDPVALDEVATWAALVEEAAEASAPDAEVWLGESGNAQCGGEPGVSDTYASGFWWLDELGQMATRGQGAVLRQALVGSDYGLLDPETLDPRPDWWTSVLWRELVGTTALEVESPSADLRLYAFCAREPRGGVTIAWIHLGSHDTTLALDLAGPHVRYPLVADALDAIEVRLDDTVLEVSGADPPLVSEPRRERGPVHLPAQSYGFVVYGEAELDACR